MVTYKTLDREIHVLSDEAKDIVAHGSHEARVFEAVRKSVGGLKISDLPVCRGDAAPKLLACLTRINF